MSAYTILKGKGRTMWMVVDQDDEAMRFYSRRECEVWIARAGRHAADHAAFAAEERAARVERVQAYLAARTLRDPAPTQLELL